MEGPQVVPLAIGEVVGAYPFALGERRVPSAGDMGISLRLIVGMACTPSVAQLLFFTWRSYMETISQPDSTSLLWTTKVFSFRRERAFQRAPPVPRRGSSGKKSTFSA